MGLLFFHDKLTDLEFMAAVRPDLERIWAITRRLEAMYREWNELEDARVAPGDRADRRRSRRCSSATSTWSAGFDDEALQGAGSPRTPT